MPASLVARAPFGRMPDGTPVDRFDLRNTGIEVRVINYGCIISSIRVPDRRGKIDDVVLGHDDLDGYLHRSRYFGAVVGRYANRIAKGSFVLDGRTYRLATNNGPNHLHGGIRGFDKIVWLATADERAGAPSVTLSHTSPDGDEGYPGALHAQVTYTLTDAGELIVEYEATADAPTPVNLTQHSYFNLAGEAAGSILGHELRLAADRFTPVDATQIPIGEIARVDGTAFDFRTLTAIGARIDADDEQLRRGGGYDHNWAINRSVEGELVTAAEVIEPASGRRLTVATTEPGVQFYAGNNLDGTLVGKSGRAYGPRSALCLETQHFPDSPNHPNFPSTILRPGERFRSKTVFTFGVV